MTKEMDRTLTTCTQNMQLMIQSISFRMDYFLIGSSTYIDYIGYASASHVTL